MQCASGFSGADWCLDGCRERHIALPRGSLKRGRELRQAKLPAPAPVGELPFTIAGHRRSCGAARPIRMGAPSAAPICCWNDQPCPDSAG
jgi:hypothetical protein